MLEQILSLVQENSKEAVVSNPSVPNNLNGDVVNTLMSTLVGGFQQEAQGGNIGGLVSLFATQNPTVNSLSSNPIVSGIAQQAIGALVQKLGLNSNVASGIAASVIPSVIAAVIGKLNDPKSGFDLSSLAGSLLGGGNSNAGGGGFNMGMIGEALADGKIDMNDLMRIGGGMLSGGGNAQQNQEQKGGLDLGGLLGGLFGK